MTSIEARIALTIAAALSLYAKSKIRANRAYTPTNMLRTASNITGKAYKRGQYQLAADDIRTKVKEVTCQTS